MVYKPPTYIFDVLLLAAVWLPFCSFILGVIRANALKSPFFLVIVICFLTFGIELSIIAWFFGQDAQLFGANIFSFLYVVLLILFYYLSIKNKHRFLNINIGIPMMLSVVILSYFFFFVDDIHQYPQWSLQTGNMIVVIFSTVMVIIEGIDLSTTIARKPVFWVALAMLVINSGFILDFCIRPFLSTEGDISVFYNTIFLQTLIINLIGYSLTIKGVWEAGRKT